VSNLEQKHGRGRGHFGVEEKEAADKLLTNQLLPVMLLVTTERKK